MSNLKRPWQVRDFMANPLESHIVCDAVEVRKYILDLEDALAGAAVISNIAGSRIKELEAMVSQPASAPDGAELDYHKVDRQVLRMAGEMSDDAKKVQPEWLWWNHEAPPQSSPSFGRWPGMPGGVPYVRADLLVQLLNDNLAPYPTLPSARVEAAIDTENMAVSITGKLLSVTSFSIPPENVAQAIEDELKSYLNSNVFLMSNSLTKRA